MGNHHLPKYTTGATKGLPGSNVAVMCLAAGGSQRMGQAKQLLPWQDTTVLQASLRPYGSLALDPLVLVVGAHSQEVVQSLEPTWRKRCQVVHNERWQEGMATSLVAGTRFLLHVEARQARRFAGVMVGLGDMPTLSAAVVGTLLDVFARGSDDLIVAPAWQGRRGHPVIIGRKYWPELLELQGDRGAATVLRRHQDKLCLVNAGEEICLDVDTPEQWQALQVAHGDDEIAVRGN